MYTCRMEKKVPKRSLAKGAGLMDSHGQHQELDDVHTYFTTNNMQQQMFVVSGNPAYDRGLKHCWQCEQVDVCVHSTVGLSQKQEVVTSGFQTHSAGRIETTSAK